jgi:hypothetical protein
LKILLSFFCFKYHILTEAPHKLHSHHTTREFSFSTPPRPGPDTPYTTASFFWSCRVSFELRNEQRSALFVLHQIGRLFWGLLLHSVTLLLVLHPIALASLCLHFRLGAFCSLLCARFCSCRNYSTAPRKSKEEKHVKDVFWVRGDRRKDNF